MAKILHKTFQYCSRHFPEPFQPHFRTKIRTFEDGTDQDQTPHSKVYFSEAHKIKSLSISVDQVGTVIT